MSRRHRTSITPGLRTFISKVITPTVLVLGVLFLIFYNFNSLAKTVTATDNHFNGNIAFSQNAFAFRFQENAGIDRPVLRNSEQDLLSYSEWSSTVSVDGNVQELWNNYHGYDIDEAKHQIYNTITNDGWQLIEIVTLVNDHTVTVTFNFDARPATLPGPAHYVFDIAHVTASSHVSVPSYEWYNYQTTNGAFTAQVIHGGWSPGASNPDIFGTISLSATGAAVPTPAIQVKNDTAIIGSNDTINLAHTFYTEYTVDNPSPFRMITLGTETLMFRPGSTVPGAPVPGVVPVPGGTPAGQ